MSPRFERRPERRDGSGARSWGNRAKPEWRPGRPAGEGASGGRGEGRGEGRSDARGQRRSGPERGESRFGDRRRDHDERKPRRFGPRPEGGDRPARGGRFQGRRDGWGDGGRRQDRDGFRDRDRAPRREPGREPGREVFREQAPLGEAETLGSTPPSDLIWGRHPAQAALESGRPVHRIWCTPELRHTPRFLQLLREAKASGVLVEEVTWARLGQLTGGAVHQGIVLQSAAAETLDLPSLIEGCAQIGEAPLLMAIDGLTDPHNLGAIVRSAEALGAHGMVLPQRRCAGLTGSVAKVAAGALEHLPVARVVNLNRALDTLKQEGYRVVGLAAEGNLSLEEADLDGPLVVVTGSEGDGLSLLTRRSCDQLVRIPLRGATPSLNASVATALLLYEVARRGWMRGLSGQAPAPRIQRPQLPSTLPAEVSATSGDDEPPQDPALPEATGLNETSADDQARVADLTAADANANANANVSEPDPLAPDQHANAASPWPAAPGEDTNIQRFSSDISL